MKRARNILLAAIFLVAPGSARGAEDGLDIIRRSIEFHGGAAYEHSRVDLELCSRSGCYEIEVENLEGAYRHLVDGAVRAGQRRVEATNDSLRYWLDGAEQAVTSSAEDQRLRDWATARIYFAFLPFRLNDPSVEQLDLGIETWGDRQLQKIKVTFRAGSSTDAEDEFLYWFDPETARLEQFAYSFEGTPGGLRFRRLGNYRRIEGLLFFDQENLGMEGDGLSVDQVDEEFVGSRMELVSMVRLQNVAVVTLAR